MDRLRPGRLAAAGGVEVGARAGYVEAKADRATDAASDLLPGRTVQRRVRRRLRLSEAFVPVQPAAGYLPVLRCGCVR